MQAGLKVRTLFQGQYYAFMLHINLLWLWWLWWDWVRNGCWLYDGEFVARNNAPGILALLASPVRRATAHVDAQRQRPNCWGRLAPAQHPCLHCTQLSRGHSRWGGGGRNQVSLFYTTVLGASRTKITSEPSWNVQTQAFRSQYLPCLTTFLDKQLGFYTQGSIGNKLQIYVLKFDAWSLLPSVVLSPSTFPFWKYTSPIYQAIP